MFTEELKLIKDAEDQADKMRKEAKVSAKLTQETDAKADKMVEEAFAREREQCQALLKDGQEIAGKLYDKAIEDAQEFCREMELKAREKKEEAIRFIAERIVDSSVNC